jgi:hypothetical protein
VKNSLVFANGDLPKPKRKHRCNPAIRPGPQLLRLP